MPTCGPSRATTPRSRNSTCRATVEDAALTSTAAVDAAAESDAPRLLAPPADLERRGLAAGAQREPQHFAEMVAYAGRITYVDLADLPHYMDEFVGASFLPHTTPELLRL